MVWWLLFYYLRQVNEVIWQKHYYCHQIVHRCVRSEQFNQTDIGRKILVAPKLLDLRRTSNLTQLSPGSVRTRFLKTFGNGAWPGSHDPQFFGVKCL